tara:strand:- start:3 stop:461 length:459 start_codon:yes stop_codon:yes gene_type:complete
MANRQRLSKEEHWKKIEPLLPKPKRRPKGKRPLSSNREVLEGVLWMLRIDARWCDLPLWYPSSSTCWRRLKLCEKHGVWLDIWRTYLAQLDAKGALDWEEAFIDGSFALAKKGAHTSGKPRMARYEVDGGGGRQTTKVLLWEAPLPRHRPLK